MKYSLKILLSGIFAACLLTSCSKPIVPKEDALKSPVHLYIYALESVDGIMAYDALQTSLKNHRPENTKLLAEYTQRQVDRMPTLFEPLQLDDLMKEVSFPAEENRFQGYCELANVYERCGDSERAREMFQKAYRCIPKKEDMNRARALAFLATFCFDANKADLGKEFIIESMDILARVSSKEALKDILDKACVEALADTGDVAFIKEKLDAISFNIKSPHEKFGSRENIYSFVIQKLADQMRFQEVEEWTASLKEHHSRMDAYEAMGAMFIKQGEKEKAIEILKKAMDEAVLTEDPFTWEGTLWYSLDLLIDLEQTDYVLDVLEKTYYQPKYSTWWCVVSLEMIANHFKDCGYEKQAWIVLERTQQLAEEFQLLKKFEEEGKPFYESRAQLFIIIGRAWIDCGKEARGLKLIDRARKLLSQSWADEYPDKQKQLEKIVSIYAKAGKNAKAIHVLESIAYAKTSSRSVFLDNLVNDFIRSEKWEQAEYFAEKLPDDDKKSYSEQLEQQKKRIAIEEADLSSEIPGFEGTWEEFLTMIRENPDQLEKFLTLFNNLINQGCLSRAEDMVQQIAEGKMSDNKKLLTLQTWAWLLNKKNYPKPALQALGHMFEVSKKELIEGYWLDGMADLLMQIEGDSFSPEGRVLGEKLFTLLNEKKK